MCSTLGSSWLEEPRGRLEQTGIDFEPTSMPHASPPTRYLFVFRQACLGTQSFSIQYRWRSFFQLMSSRLLWKAFYVHVMNCCDSWSRCAWGLHQCDLTPPYIRVLFTYALVIQPYKEKEREREIVYLILGLWFALFTETSTRPSDLRALPPPFHPPVDESVAVAYYFIFIFSFNSLPKDYL